MTARAAEAQSTLANLALAALLVFGIALLPRLAGRGRAGALVGKPAPDFALAPLANEPALREAATGAGDDKPDRSLRLQDLRGRPLLLDFWATWCGPCRSEAPIVDGVARRFRDRGLTVIGIATDAPGEGDPRSFALRHGLTYPIVQDVAGGAMHAYGVDGLPTLVIVSRSGQVTAVRTGMTEQPELDRLVENVL